MKFEHIPQLTNDGSYSTNVSLKHLQWTIGAYINEHGLDINPDFQRGHVWNNSQSTKFVEFLLRGGKSSRTIYLNHPGWMRGFEGDFVLVDGLQRLTACLKFLDNKLPIFSGHHRDDFTDNLPLLSGLVFNINNLKTRAEVLRWYLDLNDGGAVHSASEISRVKQLLENEYYKEN